MNLAVAVAERADCRRAKHGAVLVRKDMTVASVGYVGHEPGGKSCLKGECPRGLLSYEECPSLSSYDTVANPQFACESLHAEQNCILNAREDTTGMWLYITGEPCLGCVRVIRAARLEGYTWPTGGRRL